MNSKIKVLTTEEIDERYFYLKDYKAATLTYAALNRGEKIVCIESKNNRSLFLENVIIDVQNSLEVMYGTKVTIIQFTDYSELSIGKLYCAVKLSRV